MNLQEFANQLVDELQKDKSNYFPEQTGSLIIRQTGFSKLNQEGEALLIELDEHQGLRFNLDELYDDFGARSVQEAADFLSEQAKIAIDSLKSTAKVSPSWIKDYSKAQHQLVVGVCDVRRNPSFLENVPYQDLSGTGNLALLAAVEVSATMQTWVTHRLLDTWNITEGQLFRDALENSTRLRPYKIMDLSDVIAELTENKPDHDLPPSPLKVVTNTQASYGASALFYPRLMEELGEQIGNYYILPSSIHEVLLLPEKNIMDNRPDLGMRSKELIEMVREINQNTVEPKNQLSDDVYHYDAKTKQIEPAEEYEQRQQLNDKFDIAVPEQQPKIR